MKKIFTLLLLTAFITKSQAQNFGYFTSGVWLKDSAYTGFFNLYDTTDANAETQSFYNFNDTTLGTFAQNSGSLAIGGGEVKTFKNSNSNVCGVTLYYTVYLQGQRPSSPVYNAINFGFFSNCSNNVFDNGGGVCSTGDQKWQMLNQSNDLTAFAPGTYTLEIYLRETGSYNTTDQCADTVYDNNNYAAANYTASFVISGVLPVTLLNFNGNYNQSAVTLKWNVANQVNMKGYEIERSSTTANFSDISFVPAKSNSNGNLSYNFTDKIPATSYNIFYRLKMIDNNGHVNYSTVLPISLNNSNANFTAHLSSVSLTLHMPSSGNNSVVQLTDLMGKILLKQNLAAQSTDLIIPLKQTIAQSVYIVSIYDGNTGNVVSKKIILSN
jgi:hypothetical protein